MTIPSAEPKQTAVLKWGYQSNATLEKPAPLSVIRLTKRVKSYFIKKENASKPPLLKRGQKSSQNVTKTSPKIGDATDLPPVTVLLHGLSDLGETSNVGASNERRKDTLSRGDVLLSGSKTVVEAVLHNLLKTGVNLLAGPVDTGRVLGHLKTRHSNTTSVGGLTGGVPDGSGTGVGITVGLEDINSLLGGAHVGALSDELAASGNESLGLVAGDLVLGGGGESDIDAAGDVGPGAGTSDVLELGAEGSLGGDLSDLLALDLDLGNGVDLLDGEGALLAVDDESTLGVGEGDDGTAELDDLKSGVLGNVSGAGDGNALAGEGVLAAGGVLDHVLNVVDNTVSGGLGADERTTPAATLTGENTLPLVADLLVLAEHEANLAAGNTDITGGNVGVGTDVLAQLGHEGDTEAADLVVGLSLGVEVGSTLTTAHVEAGQGILEDLLETEELEDGQVHGGVETEATLVGAKSGVELDTESAVDLDLGKSELWQFRQFEKKIKSYLAFVILPDNAELDDTLGDGDDLKGLAVLGLLLEKSGVLEGGGELCFGIVSLVTPKLCPVEPQAGKMPMVRD